MDDVESFQQRLEQFQKGKQFGSVRNVQMGSIQGGSPFTYYPQGIRAPQNRFQPPNAGIAPDFRIGNEKPRYGSNFGIGDALMIGADAMEKKQNQLDKQDERDEKKQRVEGLKAQIPEKKQKKDKFAGWNDPDVQTDLAYSTTTQGKARMDPKNQSIADAMDEAAEEMDDRPDMSGAKGFGGGFRVGYTGNERNVTNNPSKGMIVGAAAGMAVRAFKSRAQSRSKPSPAETYRAGESEKSNTNDDFDWGV